MKDTMKITYLDNEELGDWFSIELKQNTELRKKNPTKRVPIAVLSTFMVNSESL